ncbi:MAG: YeeE/YedE family protein [Candidatus Sumerlaeota bacterium]|nr:YeeE/YedE family protein [Candidatus Sumerlaeota bacterium]
MSSTVSLPRWRAYFVWSVAGLAAMTLAAGFWRLWVISAFPIGCLFGFFLQKGDLCGASAFSEVLLFKDGRKLYGVWVVIVVSMLGFAAMDRLGWIQLNPKPMMWLSYTVGGVLFGVGMVLAGGCISGCLYKAGTGNLNSMAALVGIPLGVGLVEYGPLNGIHVWMQKFVVKTAQGGPLTLSSLTGLSFGSIALFLGVVTLTLAWFFAVRRRRGARDAGQPGSWGAKVLARPWKPWQAGVAVGLLGCVAYVSSAATGRNYPLGVTHGVLYAQVLLTDKNVKHVWRKAPAAPSPAPSAALPVAASKPATPPAPAPSASGPKTIVWWLVALVVGMVPGAWVAGRLSGQARLLPKPPEQIVIAFFGGIVTGVGAGFATGCVIGNIMSGWALQSVGMILFGITTLLASWATTYFYLIGGTISGLVGGAK